MKSLQECNVVMLPTEKETDICLFLPTLVPFYKPRRESNRSYQHLYVTNPNEEIKLGDWYYSGGKSVEYSIHKADTERLVELCNKDAAKKMQITKIIATTDESLKVISHFETNPDNTGSGAIMKSLPRPSNEFLKKYCELGGIWEVLVEYEEIKSCTYETCVKWLIPKVAPDNTITIKPTSIIKHKLYNRKEVEELITKGITEIGSSVGLGENISNKVKVWIKENL